LYFTSLVDGLDVGMSDESSSSEGLWSRCMCACKRHSDAKVSAGDVSGFREYLMRNQCIEQCAIYTFFTCGSYLTWAFWPNIPFLVIFRSNCEEGIYQKVLWGWLYSVFGHEDLRRWAFLANLDCLDGDWTQAACLWPLVYIEQSGGGDSVQGRRLLGAVGDRALRMGTSGRVRGPKGRWWPHTLGGII